MQDAVEDPIDELSGLLVSVTLRQLHSFIDHDTTRRIGVENFERTETQDVAVDRSHPTQ